jgi:hypothetical protein
MSDQKQLGRREFILKTLAGGLGLGTFYLTNATTAWSAQEPILIEDITTLGLPLRAMVCDSYTQGKIKCEKFTVYRNFNKICPQRFSARCMIFSVE